MPKVADELRAIFSSPAEINADTDAAIIEGIYKTFPVEDKNYRLEVSDVRAEPRAFDHHDEKDAILRGKSLTYPIRATIKMFDITTGKLVDTVTNFNLMDSFALTGKHTMMYKGSNYSVANLITLKPGVYTRTRDNDELESSFNTNSGSNFSLVLNPETLIFKIRAGNTKSSGVDVFPILQEVFKVTTADIGVFVPKEILDVNIKGTMGGGTRAVQNLYSKMVNKSIQNKQLSLEEKTVALREALESSTLDEMTTATTLGKSFTHVNAETIMRSMRNLVEVQRGDREEDNRDSLQFKKVNGLPDFISSHFEKNHKSVTGPVRVMKRGLGKMDKNKPRIRDALVSKPLNKVFTQFIQSGTLSTRPTETNPIESIENVAKATIIGPGYGGIGSMESVPDEARNIDPSHLGILDPSRTPESKSAGVDLRFTMTARRDKGGNLYARTLDPKGKSQYLSVHEMMGSTIGFPDQMAGDSPTVMAQVNGKFKEVPRNKVDAWVPAGSDLFTATTNLVPFLNSNHPGRLTMAGKALPQSLSLREREQPLVQTLDHNGVPYIKSFANVFSSKSKATGTIVKTTPKSITVQDSTGNEHTTHMVENLPFNMKGFHDDEDHTFKVGDKVRKGQSIADNNYTKDGNLALGKNLHVAYIPWKGSNHEDGIVISRSAASSMTSNHATSFSYSVAKTTVMDTNRFKASFERKYTPKQLDGFDQKGLPKKGRKLEYGDPIALILEPKEISDTDKVFGRLHKQLISPFRDSSLIWDHHEMGVIVDVNFSGRDLKVLIRSEKGLEMGDKVTNLHGGKGVISSIVEDHEMPHSKDTGKPVDLLLNPASVTSRINLGQIIETAAAKIAKKTGKPYLVQNYANANNVKKISDELKEHGLSDTEVIYDPQTGKVIGDKVMAGPQYILKLDKTVDANYSARSVGGYDNVGQPVKGGSDGSKGVGYMEFLGLLGSNARANLREMATTKSEGGALTDQNDYWDKYVRGMPLPKPKTTFATKKFMDYLVGSGIDVSHRNGELSLSPLTDEAILKRSNGALTDSKKVYGKDLKPEKGGLFDTVITGGPDGHKWSHFKLDEPIVNPIMEKSVTSMLGLKKQEFLDLTSGKLGVIRKRTGVYDLINTSDDSVIRTHNVSSQGLFKKASEDDSDGELKVGGHAFKEMLADINTDTEVQVLKDAIPKLTSRSKKDALIKRVKYLHGMSRQGYTDPSKAVMLHNIPVIPPVMRPISVSGGRVSSADVNALYEDFHLEHKNVGELSKLLSPDFEDLQKARAATYGSVKAIMAGGDPTNYKNKQSGTRGLLTQITGSGTGPKHGFFQKKLMTRKQDISGRGTIYAAPDVGFNEAKLPKDQLWKMYEMHIKRDLAQKGYDPALAKAAYEERNPAATASFNKQVENVPVIITRAPTLMKTNILAVKPIPSEGKTIGLNILHLPGFAADYDGDAMSLFAPVTPEAIQEAKDKLLPENHMHDARKGFGSPMYAPAHEAILGSMHMTEKDTKQKVVKFKTEKDVLAALASGTINEKTPVKIG